MDDIPEDLWIPALDIDGDIRDRACAAELAGLVHLWDWPARMRLIVRKEHPYSGAQLRFTDRNGVRLTAFVTNTMTGRLHTLGLRHRRRARRDDRVHTAKATGLTKLPLHGFSQNEILLAIIALATELTAWMRMLVLTSNDARRWERTRLRLHMFSIAGRIARHARTTRLRLARRAPWLGLVASVLARLEVLPAPTQVRVSPVVRAEKHDCGEWTPAASRLHRVDLSSLGSDSGRADRIGRPIRSAAASHED